MGKSTINGHFQLLFVCSPEGTCSIFCLVPHTPFCCAKTHVSRFFWWQPATGNRPSTIGVSGDTIQSAVCPVSYTIRLDDPTIFIILVQIVSLCLMNLLLYPLIIGLSPWSGKLSHNYPLFTSIFTTWLRNVNFTIRSTLNFVRIVPLPEGWSSDSPTNPDLWHAAGLATWRNHGSIGCQRLDPIRDPFRVENIDILHDCWWFSQYVNIIQYMYVYLRI